VGHEGAPGVYHLSSPGLGQVESPDVDHL
jgi:hypothetical protein